ncbi:MAG: hypothetical protein V7707_19500 [Motiliproteus sp.]
MLHSLLYWAKRYRIKSRGPSCGMLSAMLVSGIFLSGCQQGGLNDYQSAVYWHPLPSVESDNNPSTEPPPQQWLLQLQTQLLLSPEQAQQALLELPPFDSKALQQLADFEQFNYLLLQQQRQQREGWIFARDGFRALDQRYQQQPLSGLFQLLQAHNQTKINHHQQLSKLTKRLQQTEQQLQISDQLLLESKVQSEQLEAKIDALTNLERSLNTRKEITNDAEVPEKP